MKKIILIVSITLLLSIGCSKVTTKNQTLEKPIELSTLNNAEYSVDQSLKSNIHILKVNKKVGKNIVKPNENEILKQFKMWNKTNNFPRMIIFINRRLSEDIKDWIVTKKISLKNNALLNLNYDIDKEQGKGSLKQSVNSEIYISNYNKQDYDNMERKILWAIEEGFNIPFIDAGSNIVDYRMMLRTTAKEMKNNGKDSYNYGIKNIEIEAMENKADYYIEVTFDKNLEKNTPLLKSTIINIKTGKIKAIVFTRLNTQKKQKYVATSNGYQLITENKSKKKLVDFARIHAFDVMKKIIKN